MTEREEVIDNLDKVWHYIMKQSNSTLTGVYTIMRYTDYITDAIKLLRKYDVTPEELERLKRCNHDCKIDCLLESYNKVVAERDELLEKQKPVKPMVIRKDELAYIMPGAVVWYEAAVWYDEQPSICPVCVERVGITDWNGKQKVMIQYTDGYDDVADYGKGYRLWTARPTEEQRRKEKWGEDDWHGSDV